MIRNILLGVSIALFALAYSAQAQEPQGSELWDRASYGSIPGITAVALEGYNGAITTTLEPLWPESTAYTFSSTNLSSPTISSASANDTSAGTGARTVRVTCVDSTYTVTTGDYTMNGQTGVSVTQSCMVVNKMEVLTAGSGLTNAGIIYVGTGAITTGKPANVDGLIAASSSQSNSFIYAVPANKKLICAQWYASSRNTTAGGHEIVVDWSENGGPFKRRFFPGFLNSAQMFMSDYMIGFPEKTRLQMKVLASAGTGPAYGFANCLLIDSAASNANQNQF